MKKKIEVIVCSVLIILTVAFIWNNSRKTVPESVKDTNIVASIVEGAAESAGKNSVEKFENYNAFLNYIRKCAHAVEFFFLGLEITVFALIISKKFKPQTLWNILSSTLAIAVIDESIQILSERGPSIRDVLIDLGGAVIGVITVLLINFIISSLRGRKKYGKA